MQYLALLIPPIIAWIIDASSYGLQITGVFIIMYLLFSLKRKPHPILTVFIIHTLTLYFVFSSDGIYSMLFFIFYFVVFLVAFLLNPVMVFLYLFSVLGLFIPQIIQIKNLQTFIPLLGLILIIPLAYFFGKTIKNDEVLKEKLELEEKEIEKLKNEEINTNNTNVK